MDEPTGTHPRSTTKTRPSSSSNGTSTSNPEAPLYGRLRTSSCSSAR